LRGTLYVEDANRVVPARRYEELSARYRKGIRRTSKWQAGLGAHHDLSACLQISGDFENGIVIRIRDECPSVGGKYDFTGLKTG
jgi:hypothetical protein